MQGPIKDVLAHYLKTMEARRIDLAHLADNRGAARIRTATCHGLDGSERYRFAPFEGMEIRLGFVSEREIVRPNVSVSITDGRPGALLECSMLEDGQAPGLVGREWECRLHIDSVPLRSRLYQIWAEVQESSGRGQLMERLEVGGFRIDAPSGIGPQAVANAALGGPVAVSYSWDVR